MVKDSIIGANVRVNGFSQVDGCIIMEGAEIARNCKIKNAIIDKHVKIPEGTEIGYDAEKDSERYRQR